MGISEDKQLEIYESAVSMVKSGKSDAEVMTHLQDIGLQESEASVVLQNVTRYRTQEVESRGGTNMLYGALWCVGGIIATTATDGHVMFYGAIIYGGLRFLAGLAQSFSKG
jgi:hypothetical protein